jgi:hypothetical protein
MSRSTILAASALALGGWLPAHVAGQLERPFPMVPQATQAGDLLVVRVVDDAMAELAALESVVLTRQPIATPGAALVVDGVPLAGRRLDEGISLWTGRVRGQADSEVFLALSAW